MPIKLPRLAVLGALVFDSLKSVHRTAKVGSYAWTVRKVPALAVLVVDHKTASVGSFDGTFKTAVYGSCSQV